ncbi:hypothetical protein [Nostoc sp. FACHB-110]|uniref:hypothetical protein n=1 Tax=Nostoc sp. FACHB-110 TaxID=2692834 RepID=UPI0016834B54|nr:hypothetical protein [Nostoc sp. FACHB-110]MBD2438543.1 hypothetical protein [Nostoc sp. FACHB-110]
MLKSTVKSIAVLLTSLAVVVSVCQSANAQLNVGQRKVQRGLEREYLQYQLGQRNLSDMLVIPGCSVGSGTGCNKTGSVLQQILAMNGGPSYYDLAIRAAGGKSNFDAFSAYYGNNPRILEVPFASFWKNQSPQVMDGYQYVLGQSVSNQPVLGLGAVTKRFTWSPISRGDNALSPRQGLLDFKYAFGRELLVETSKVPNLEQQIRSLDLPPEMTQFYLNNLSRGLNALNTGNEAVLQDSILRIVSFPYSPNATTSGDYGRVPIGLPTEFNNLEGIPTAAGDIVTPDIALGSGAELIAVPDTTVALDVGELAGASGFNPSWLLPLVPLIALLFAGGGDNSSSRASSDVPNNPGPTPITPTPTPQCPGGGGVISVPPCDNPPPPPVKPVDEPSVIKAVLLLTLVMCILSWKQRAIQTKN